jgi:hypothetical protein
MRINWFGLFNEPKLGSIKRLVDKLYRVKGVRQEDVEKIAEALLTYSKDSGASVEDITSGLGSLFEPKQASLVITQKDSNDTTTNTMAVVAHPSGTTTLNPPVAKLGIGVTSGGGYYKSTGWELESGSEGFTSGTNELIAETDGLYIVAVGWGGFRHTVNATTVGFVLGVEDETGIALSQRPTSAEVPNGDDIGNVAGGGRVRLKAGDKLSVWLAASKTGNVILGNANLTLFKVSN